MHKMMGPTILTPQMGFYTNFVSCDLTYIKLNQKSVTT